MSTEHVEASSEPISPAPAASVPIVPDLDEWFELRHGFPRANWELIEDHFVDTLNRGKWDEAWSTIARHWLMRIASQGSLELAQSKHFYLLSPRAAKNSSELLEGAEQLYDRLCAFLEVRADPHYGRIVLIRLADREDYRRYITDFYESGASVPESAGLYINQGLPHIAFVSADDADCARILAHELTHLLVAHLPLPTWVNEGFAGMMEGRAAETADIFAADSETLLQHQAFWNQENIQLFWTGELFERNDETNLLFYELAEGLFAVIQNELQAPSEALHAFVEHASLDDCGAGAARKYLRADLCELVEFLLGPGKWQPRFQPKTWITAGWPPERPQNSD